MNKLFTKIATLSVGLAMAVGVGVALGQKDYAEAKAVDTTDYLDKAFTGNPSSYKSWTGSDNSDATYSGQSSGTNESIQLRATSPSGIVTTTSGGYLKSITASWNAATANGRTLDIYGKHSAYSEPADLYSNDSSTKGELIGSIVYGTSTVFTATADYEFIGIRSRTSAQYVSSLTIVWSSTSVAPSSFTVTYDANGGTGTMSDANEYSKNDTVVVADNDFSPADSFHIFDSFNTKADGSGDSYAEGDTFEITGNTTLYAIWSLKNVTLPNGSYSATFPFSDPHPSDFAVKNGSSETVGYFGVVANGLTKVSGWNEYELAVTGSLVFKNHTNAPVTKIVFKAYKYDNFKLSVGSTVLHTGDGSNGSDPRLFEFTLETPSTSDIKIEHYTGEGTYTQKFYSVDIYLKVGADVVHATDVSLNASEGNVYIGKTRQLSATVLPVDADDKSVSWTSSNNNIATVDSNGLVTGVAAGSATITATTTDGGLTATFSATVKALSWGTEENPLAVEEAREVLEISGASVSSNQLTVRGVVSSSNVSNSKNVVWLQSSDGTVNKYFEIYDCTYDDITTSVDLTASDALKGLTITVTGYGTIYSGSTYELYNVNSTKPSVVDVTCSAEAFASMVLNDTKAKCDAYVDGETSYDSQKSAFTSIWSKLADKYSFASSADKTTLAEANRDEDGTTIEQAMLRYDFLTGKYQLTNFITGRTPMSAARGFYSFIENGSNSNILLIVVVSSIAIAVAGVAFFTLKKKHN